MPGELAAYALLFASCQEVPQHSVGRVEDRARHALGNAPFGRRRGSNQSTVATGFGVDDAERDDRDGVVERLDRFYADEPETHSTTE